MGLRCAYRTRPLEDGRQNHTEATRRIYYEQYLSILQMCIDYYTETHPNEMASDASDIVTDSLLLPQREQTIQ